MIVGTLSGHEKALEAKRALADWESRRRAAKVTPDLPLVVRHRDFFYVRPDADSPDFTIRVPCCQVDASDYPDAAHVARLVHYREGAGTALFDAYASTLHVNVAARFRRAP